MGKIQGENLNSERYFFSNKVEMQHEQGWIIFVSHRPSPGRDFLQRWTILSQIHSPVDKSQSDSPRKNISQGMSSSPYLELPKVLLSGLGMQINCQCQFKARTQLPWGEVLCLHVISWNKSNVSAKEPTKSWQYIKAVFSQNNWLRLFVQIQLGQKKPKNKRIKRNISLKICQKNPNSFSLWN